jgi:hypothetical protein
MSRKTYCNISRELNKRGGIDVIFFGGFCGAYMILRAFANIQIFYLNILMLIFIVNDPNYGL